MTAHAMRLVLVHESHCRSAVFALQLARSGDQRCSSIRWARQFLCAACRINQEAASAFTASGSCRSVTTQGHGCDDDLSPFEKGADLTN